MEDRVLGNLWVINFGIVSIKIEKVCVLYKVGEYLYLKLFFDIVICYVFIYKNKNM